MKIYVSLILHSRNDASFIQRYTVENDEIIRINYEYYSTRKT